MLTRVFIIFREEGGGGLLVRQFLLMMKKLTGKCLCHLQFTQVTQSLILTNLFINHQQDISDFHSLFNSFVKQDPLDLHNNFHDKNTTSS